MLMLCRLSISAVTDLRRSRERVGAQAACPACRSGPGMRFRE